MVLQDLRVMRIQFEAKKNEWYSWIYYVHSIQKRDSFINFFKQQRKKCDIEFI